MKSGGLQNRGTSAITHKAREWIGNRHRIDWWVYINRAHDLEVLEIIDRLKRKGLFRSSVMKGLRVVYAYMNDDFDTIYELLPNLKGQGCNDDITAQIADLKRLVLEQNTREIPPQTLIMKSAQPLPAVPKAEVKQAAVMSANDIADNFLSMFD